MNCILHCALLGFYVRIQMTAPTRSQWCFFDNCEGSTVGDQVLPDSDSRTSEHDDEPVVSESTTVDANDCARAGRQERVLNER